MQMSKMSIGSLDVIYITMECVIGMFAVVGNALVVWAVKLNPALQKTTFLYIISLAFMDIAMGILVAPLAVLVSLGVIIHFYSCLFMCCLMMIFSHASILSLLAIAVDRYLRVKLPFRYRAAVTKKRICGMLGLCWLVSVLVGLIPMLGWNQHTGSSGYIECHYSAVMRMDYVVYFSFFTWILLPLLIMCALYAEIFYIIWIKLSLGSASPLGGGTICAKEYKMAKNLALVLFLFAVSWLPLGVLNCISYFCPSCIIPRPLMYLSILLSHANSAMNPAVYAFRIQKFKETFAFILRTYILLQKSEATISSVKHTAEQQEASTICAVPGLDTTTETAWQQHKQGENGTNTKIVLRLCVLEQ
ncbi:adenosine receptor A3-like isoform X1 [Phaenicophaeus curvirostris]|uniref:adenosine receptor A3-like isoform X1 n=1 Tax=Phaenicophaeus curvirostris TaxID=33595 RepID=UPI0037F0B174